MTPRAEAKLSRSAPPGARIDGVRLSARSCQPCQVAFDAEAELVRCSPYSECEGPVGLLGRESHLCSPR